MTDADTKRFRGFGPLLVTWFQDLEQNDSKSFFETTKALWQRDIRDPLEALLGDLADEFGGRVKIFRQHRDVRFSKDKSPYKTNTYGIIFEMPKSEAALYVAVSAQGLHTATGYHELAKDQLERFRAAAADDKTGPVLEERLEQIRARGIVVDPPSLKTAPRGYPRDHERAALLRYKELTMGRHFSSDDMMNESIRGRIAETFRAAEPVNEWLDKHVGPSTIPPEIRYGGGKKR